MNEQTELKPSGNAAGMMLPMAAVLLAIFFWDSMLVLPIKYLTVFFHELSHGLAAVFTGGEIVKIEINANLGGVCWTAGGIRFIVTSAGYLGSLFWGCLILLGAVKTRFDQQITAGLGILLLAVTAIWVRNLEGIIICSLTGMGLLALAAYTSEKVCDQFLKFLGLTSCLYVLIDIKEDLIDRSIACSDASKIGEMLFMPGWLVGLVWLAIAGYVTWHVLSFSLKE